MTYGEGRKANASRFIDAMKEGIGATDPDNDPVP